MPPTSRAHRRHPFVRGNSKSSKLKAHTLASLFPAMEGDEYAALVANIREHGLREPIVLFGNQVLDGWHRYSACVELGLRPQFETYAGSDPAGYVVSLNLMRRHMTTSQRAMVAAELATLPRGANQHSEGLPIGRASTMLNVSDRTVARAVNIKRTGSSALQEAVKEGKVSILRGAQLAELPKKKQVEALKQLDMFLPSYFAASRRKLEDILATNKYAPAEQRLRENCDSIITAFVGGIRKLEVMAADIGRPGAPERFQAELAKLTKRIIGLADDRWKIRDTIPVESP